MKVKDYSECKNVGDWFFEDVDAGPYRRLSFLCPCGCGALAGVRVRVDGKNDGISWGWNQSEEKPTVTPSININNGEWHGYLRDGIFVNA